MTDDPLERRMRDSMQRDESWIPDVAAARATLAERRAAGRTRRIVATVATAAAVGGLVVGASLFVGRGGSSGPSGIVPAGPGRTPTEGWITYPAPTCPPRAPEMRGPGPHCGYASVGPIQTGETSPKPTSIEASATPEPQPSKSPLPSPTGSERPVRLVEVDENDAGKTITLYVGDMLIVTLHGSDGFLWKPPESSDASVLLRAGVTTETPNGERNEVAKFRAESAGTAQVTSTQDPTCREANPPCMAPSRAYEITVRVLP